MCSNHKSPNASASAAMSISWAAVVVTAMVPAHLQVLLQKHVKKVGVLLAGILIGHGEFLPNHLNICDPRGVSEGWELAGQFHRRR